MKRPRQHVLETESRKAFERLLPDAWVYRPFNPDYAIDYQVEIFSDEISQGKAFYVQLKGTDSESGKKKASLDLDLGYYEYYASLPLPILLVVYSSDSGHFWGIWVNKYLSTKNLRSGQKYLRINFEKKDEIDAYYFNRLESEFTLQMHESRALFITTDGQADSERFATVARKWIETCYPGVLKHEEGNLPLYTKLEITCDKRFLRTTIRDALLGTQKTRCIIKKDKREFLDFPVYKPDSLPEELFEFFFIIATIMLGVAPELALDGIESFFSKYRGKYKKFETIVHVVHEFISARRYSSLRKITAECILADFIDDFQYINLAIFFQLGKCKQGSSELRQLYNEGLQKAIDASTGDAKGIFCYNYANSSKSELSPAQSLSWYQKARRYKPEYLKMDYWWKEVAGVLFKGRHYKSSASCYEYASQLSDKYEPLILALTADALFMSRQFKDSTAWFERYFEKETDPSSEWFLKHKVCSFLLSNGFPKGPTQRDLAVEIADSAIKDQEANDELKADRLVKAIDADPLCCLAWYNYGWVQLKSGQQSQAMIAYLVCAVTCDWDREAWMNALFLSFNEKNDVLFLHIANALREKYGKGILRDISKLIQSQKIEEAKKKGLYDEIVKIFDEIEKIGGVLPKKE